MKIKNCVCSLLLYLSVSLSGGAQTWIVADRQMYSPQASGMVRYGSSHPNLCTGTVNVEIPLYTYKDKDFEFPMSLRYASNGYIPNKSSGIVGMDWVLAVGGVISREVHGVPDESQHNTFNDYVGIPFNVMGYCHYPAWADHTKLKTVVTRKNFPLFSIGYWDYDMVNINPICYEAEPDVFHFSFLGYSGCFQLLPDRKTLVYNTNIPQGEIKVDAIQLINEDSYITLITGDGYKYKFGGTSFSRECSYNADYMTVKYPDSWYLSEITAPNGRKIKFTYLQKVAVPVYTQHVGMVGEAWTSAAGSGFFNGMQVGLTRTNMDMAQLRSIVIDNRLTYSFQYTAKEQETALSGGKIDVGNRLTSINIRGGEISRSISLDYIYPAKGNKKMFLSNVSVTGEGRYTMEYYNIDKLSCPDMGVYGLDHWGYYNANFDSDWHNFIPVELNLNNLEEKIINKKREPNSDASRFGMLSKIIYPAKGYSEFEYEAHDYQQAVKRELNNYYEPELVVSSGVAGGLRIKKVRDYDGNNTVSREYLYKKDRLLNQSSGILLHWPRYALAAKMLVFNQSFQSYKISSDFEYYTLDQNHIEYSNVFEKLADGSMIEYRFTNYSDTPDVRPVGEYGTVVENQDQLKFLTPEVYLANITRKSNSLHAERGRLLYKMLWNNQLSPVWEEKNIYQYDISAFQPMIEVAANTWYERRLFYKRFLLAKVQRTEYADGYTMTETTGYKYNRWGQRIEVKVTDAQGAKRTENYKYPADLATASTDNVSGWMVARNMLCYPVTMSKSFTPAGQEYGQVYETTKWRFGEFNGNIQLQETERYIPLYQQSRVYDAYDRLGNLLQTTDPDGLVTTYIWGHGGIHLLAVVKNADLNAVAAIPGLANIKTIPLAGDLGASEEFLLRQISGSQVTTYSYKPLVGVKKETDPNEHSCYYEYDDSGRLVSVKNTNSELIEKYQYYIQP